MSNSLDLKIGDIVRLKSGSTNMTVDVLPDEIDTTKVQCKWQDGTVFKTHVFEIDTLQKVDPAAEAAANAAASKEAHAKLMKELGIDKSF